MSIYYCILYYDSRIQVYDLIFITCFFQRIKGFLGNCAVAFCMKFR